MDVTFLEGPIPLVKSFYLVNDELMKNNYPNIRNFTSHTYDVNNLAKLHTLIQEHANQGHCLLKGTLQRELQAESRAGSTNGHSPTSLLVFDLDGVKNIDTIEQFVELLPPPFRKVSYIAQYSASMGVIDKGLSAHVIFWLRNEVTPPVLKQWFTRLNLDTPQLRNSLRLTRTHNALKYPLDVSVGQNDKLIFIAPPRIGKGVKNTFKGERIQLITKKTHTVNFNWNDFNPGTLKKDNLEALNDKRQANGLRKIRSSTERIIDDTVIGKVSDQPEISGIKTDRGFVYLNLNGGDSWGYFHPITNPDVLYNFKSEPNYLTRELLPAYYQDAVTTAREAKDDYIEEQKQQRAEENNEEGWQYFTFIDHKTSQLYKGRYDNNNETLELYEAPNMYTIKNYQRIHGLEVTSNLDEWLVEFDPSSIVRFNPENRHINTFTPTEYLTSSTPSKTLHPVVEKIIRHATGGCNITYITFINWLAYIFQTRNKTGIAWILHGTYGTGKGLLFNKIIEPILGFAYTPRLDIEALISDQFNGNIKEGILALIDEADLDAISKKQRSNKVMKELITEPTHTIREMRLASYKTRSFLNLLIFANEKHSAIIMPGDRRYSVAPRQETPIDITPEEIAQIEPALPEICGYFMQYEVNKEAVHRPLDNDARRFIQRLSMNANTEAFNALREGNLTFFVENCPEIERPVDLKDQTNRSLPLYREALLEAYDNANAGLLSRDAVETLIYYTTGLAQPTPHKFTKWMHHNNIDISVVKISNATKRGIRVSPWQFTDTDEKELKSIEKELTQLRAVRPMRAVGDSA